MASFTENTIKAASCVEDPESEPSRSQHIRSRGRTDSPLLKVLVYDADKKTVEVQRRRDVAIEDSQKVKLPSKSKRVTLFVDSETESKPTTDAKTEDGQGNVILTNLYLDRLGKYHQLLRFLGRLSTLYVMNSAPWSGSSSQITTHRSDGLGQ